MASLLMPLGFGPAASGRRHGSSEVIREMSYHGPQKVLQRKKVCGLGLWLNGRPQPWVQSKGNRKHYLNCDTHEETCSTLPEKDKTLRHHTGLGM
jgi:hypothetical protein